MTRPEHHHKKQNNWKVNYIFYRTNAVPYTCHLAMNLAKYKMNNFVFQLTFTTGNFFFSSIKKTDHSIHYYSNISDQRKNRQSPLIESYLVFGFQILNMESNGICFLADFDQRW